MKELRQNYLRSGSFYTFLLALLCSLRMRTASFGNVARDDGARSDRIESDVYYTCQSPSNSLHWQLRLVFVFRQRAMRSDLRVSIIQ